MTMGVRFIFLYAILVLVTRVSSQKGICPTSCPDYARKQNETKEMMSRLTKKLEDRMSAIESMNTELEKKAKRQARKIEKLDSKLKAMKQTERPVPHTDKGWGPWTAWTQCSVTCGIGYKRKNRTCLGEQRECEGISRIQLPCRYSPCPDNRARPNGQPQGQWTPWTKCSVSCGLGYIERSRICLAEQKDCTGINRMRVPCRNPPCVQRGLYTPWGSWSGCTVTCGAGVTTRRRLCISGVLCRGNREERKECNNGPCREEGMAEKRCELTRNEHCFMIIDGQERISRPKHEVMCEKHGGHLANIYDAGHLESLNKYILGLELASSYFWTGMDYSRGNGLTWNDGSKGTYEKWILRNPVGHPLWTGILFHVEDKRGIDIDEVIVIGATGPVHITPKAGFRNMDPSSIYRYSICEFKLDESS